MGYKKVGGLHFVKLGRFGFSFWISKPKPNKHARYVREHARFTDYATRTDRAAQIHLAKLGVV